MKIFKLLSLSTLFFVVIYSCTKDEEPETPVTPPGPEVVVITDLDFTIDVNAENPLQIGVTPSATNATEYWVYFDSEGASADYVSTSGSLVSNDYPAAAATYVIKVIAKAENAEDVELTKNHTVSYESAKTIADFEDAAAAFLIAEDDNLTFEIADNPDGTGNSSAKVGKIMNGGSAYEAASIALNTLIDMKEAGRQTISFDFYQEGAQSVDILAKLEGSESADETVYDVEVLSTATDAGWQTVSFDFANSRGNSYPNGDQTLAPLDAYDKLVIFIGFGVDLPGTFYIDNVVGGTEGSAARDTDSDGIIDVVDGCDNEYGTIDNNGCPVVTGPSSSATVPTYDAVNVVSIFSDSYTPAANVANWTTDWGQGTTSEEHENTAGDVSRKYSFADAGNGRYTGIDLETSIDATGADIFQMDVWSDGLNEFTFKIVDFGPNDAYGDGAGNAGGDDTEHEVTVTLDPNSTWQTVSFNTADFSGLTGSANIFQFVIGAAADGTVFIDNIIAVDTGATSGPTAPDTSAAIPSYDASKVASIFSDSYTAATSVANWTTDWGQGTTGEEHENTAGDVSRKYTFADGGNGRYTGVDLASSVDASGYDVFQMDVWSADMTAFKFKVVDFGTNGEYDPTDDNSEHEITATIDNAATWQTVTVSIADMTGLTNTSGIRQFVVSADQDGTVFIDNIIFADSGTTTTPTGPTTAAPTPSYSSNDVVSIFSDSYTEAASVSNWTTDWGQGTAGEEYEITSGDVARKYIFTDAGNGRYTGIDLASAVDVSSTDMISMDIWSPDMTSVKFKVVDFGADGEYAPTEDNSEHEITATIDNTGTWQTVTVSLADMTGLTNTSGVRQFVVSADADGTVFFDNIMFIDD